MIKGFDYNSEELLKAKTLSLYNANLCATANRIVSNIKTPDEASMENIMSKGGLSIDKVIEEGAPYTDIDSIDFSLFESAKEELSKVTQKISLFNVRVDHIIRVISNKLDPNLATEIKKMEQEAIKDYLDLGAQGVMIDKAELYNLLIKYKDEITLELTDEQKELFEVYLEEGKNLKDYDSMSPLEKSRQNVFVFGTSFVEGLVKTAEKIADGLIYANAQSVSMEAYTLGDVELSEGLMEGALEIIDVDVAGNMYDSIIEASNTNKYIAYGEAHKVGLMLGGVTGDALIAMVPGGKAVTLALETAKAIGESLEDTVGEDLNYRIVKANFAALKEMASGGIDLINNESTKKVLNIILEVSDTTVNDLVDYYMTGQTENKDILNFIKEYGEDIVLCAGKTVFFETAEVVKESIGYTGFDDYDDDYDVDYDVDDVLENEEEGFIDNFKDSTVDEIKDNITIENLHGEYSDVNNDSIKSMQLLTEMINETLESGENNS